VIHTAKSGIKFLSIMPATGDLLVADNELAIIRPDGTEVARWPLPHTLRRVRPLNDQRVVTVDVAGYVRIYEPGRASPARAPLTMSHGREVLSVAFAPRGRTLTYVDWAREECHCVNLGAPAEPERVFAIPDRLFAEGYRDIPGFRPGTSEYVTRGTNTFDFFDISGERPTLLRHLTFRGRGPEGAFSGTGKYLLVSHSAGLDWLDLDSGEQRPLPPASGKVGPRMAVSTDGATAAYAAGEPVPEWKVWRTSDMSPLLQQSVKAFSAGVAVHPDQPFMAISFVGGETEVWDIAAKRLLHRLPDSTMALRLQFFGRDRLMACCQDNSLRIWDWRLGQELLQLPHRVNAFSFSADGLALASGGYNPTVAIRFAVPWWFEQSDTRFFQAIPGEAR
jgi:hypothetical protein